MDAATRALVDDLAAAVTNVFTDVETYLLEYLSWIVDRDRTVWDVDVDRVAMIRDLERETRAMVDGLRDVTPALATQVVQAAADRGAAGIRDELWAVLPDATRDRVLDSSHLYAVQATTVDLVSRFSDVTNRILRFPDDVHRRFDATIVAEKLTGQQHTIEFQREALADWASQGIRSFVDVSGRRWSTGAYIEMATRTGVQRALTEGRRAQALHSGFKLGLIQEIPGCCEKCAAWAGAVVALDGSITVGTHVMKSAVDGSPVRVDVRATVNQARREGWQHPNCRGNLAVFIPGATDPEDHLVEYDADRYDAEQSLREQERDIRAAKRKLALDPDDKAARKDLNESRAKARELVEEFELPRRPARESLAWSSPSRRQRSPKRPDLASALTGLPELPTPSSSIGMRRVEKQSLTLLDRVIEAEPAQTAMLARMAREHGAELVGLEFRKKSFPSLTRKIESKVRSGETMHDAAASISDALRYTMQIPDDRYSAVAQSVIDTLKAQGATVRVKNYWDRPDYRGINAPYTLPDGLKVELQFHTPTSLRVKEGELHTLYEAWRVLDPASAEADALLDKMEMIANRIPTPKGALDVHG